MQTVRLKQIQILYIIEQFSIYEIVHKTNTQTFMHNKNRDFHPKNNTILSSRIYEFNSYVFMELSAIDYF